MEILKNSNITYLKSSIFRSPAQTIVNTVNTKGVMGKGLALEFKYRFPTMFEEYLDRCKMGEIDVGKLFLFKKSTPWVLNFPTKKDWRFPSKLDYLVDGLSDFRENYKNWGITSIAFPQLGVRNGKLEWEVVKDLMEEYLSNLDIEVFIHIYSPPNLDKFLSNNPEKLALPDWKYSRNKKSLYYVFEDYSFVWSIGSSIIDFRIKTAKETKSGNMRNDFLSIRKISLFDNDYSDKLSKMLLEINKNKIGKENSLITLERKIIEDYNLIKDFLNKDNNLDSLNESENYSNTNINKIDTSEINSNNIFKMILNDLNSTIDLSLIKGKPVSDQKNEIKEKFLNILYKINEKSKSFDVSLGKDEDYPDIILITPNYKTAIEIKNISKSNYNSWIAKKKEQYRDLYKYLYSLTWNSKTKIPILKQES